MSKWKSIPRFRKSSTPSVVSEASECETVFRGVTVENTKKFRHKFTRGRVVKVYDGDTVHIVDENRERHVCRLAGIDAPEVTQKKGQDPSVKKAGLVARDFLSRLCLGKMVEVIVIDQDSKFNRPLVKLYRKKYGRTSLNDFMVKSYLAVPYDGKRKPAVDWAFMLEKHKSLKPPQNLR